MTTVRSYSHTFDRGYTQQEAADTLARRTAEILKAKPELSYGEALRQAGREFPEAWRVYSLPPGFVADGPIYKGETAKADTVTIARLQKSAGDEIDRLVRERMRKLGLAESQYGEILAQICREHPDLARQWSHGVTA